MIRYEDFLAPGTWIVESTEGLPTPPPGLERCRSPGQHSSRSVGEAPLSFEPLPRALRQKILEGAMFVPAPSLDCAQQDVDEVHPSPDCAQQDIDEVGSLSTGCGSSSSSSSGRLQTSCGTLSDSGASTSSIRSSRSSPGKGLERLQATALQRSSAPIHHAVSHHLVEPSEASEFDSSGGTSHRREWLQPEGFCPPPPVLYVKKPRRPREFSGSSFSALGLVASTRRSLEIC